MAARQLVAIVTWPHVASAPMRVLLLFEFPTLNGGENSWLSLAPDLLAAGVDAVAAAPPSGPLACALRRLGIPLVSWDGRATAGSLAARRRQLQLLLRRVRPGLVHANSLSMARLAGPVCRSQPVPSLGHLRDMLRPSRTALEDLAANTRLIAVSRATRDWYLRLGLAAPPIRVAYNGVDLQRYGPRPPSGYLHRQLGLAADVRLIAQHRTVGRAQGNGSAAGGRPIRPAPAAGRPLPDCGPTALGESGGRAIRRRTSAAGELPPISGKSAFSGSAE